VRDYFLRAVFFVDFLAVDFFADFLRVRFAGDGGTSAPFARASFNAIAMACLRLRTRPPDPDLSDPFFCRRTALATVFDAALFRLAIIASVRIASPS